MDGSWHLRGPRAAAWSDAGDAAQLPVWHRSGGQGCDGGRWLCAVWHCPHANVVCSYWKLDCEEAGILFLWKCPGTANEGTEKQKTRSWELPGRARFGGAVISIGATCCELVFSAHYLLPGAEEPQEGPQMPHGCEDTVTLHLRVTPRAPKAPLNTGLHRLQPRKQWVCGGHTPRAPPAPCHQSVVSLSPGTPRHVGPRSGRAEVGCPSGGCPVMSP